MNKTLLGSAILATLLASAGSFAFADPHENDGRHGGPPPWAGASHDDDDEDRGDEAPRNRRAQNAGVLVGQVLGVDFQRGLLSLASNRGRVDVFVLPTTSIQGRGNGYRTLADIGRGSRVSIFVSQIAGRFIAQIIRIR